MTIRGAERLRAALPTRTGTGEAEAFKVELGRPGQTRVGVTGWLRARSRRKVGKREGSVSARTGFGVGRRVVRDSGETGGSELRLVGTE